MSTILLCGHSGLLGQALLRESASTPLCPSSTQLDFNDLKGLKSYLNLHQPRTIINAAAYTQVDLAQTESAQAYRINHQAVAVLAEYAKQADALLVHFSTDYVFDGTAQSPYTETDTPKPLNIYGHSKYLGEQAITQQQGNHLIFRLGWLYGIRGQHFASTILQRLLNQKPLSVVDDQIGTPTPVEWLGPLILGAIQAHQQGQLASGLYHLSPAGQGSWFDFATALAQQLQALSLPGLRPLPSLQRTNQKQSPRPAQRPAYSVLDNTKLQRALPFSRPDWQTLLQPLLPRIVAQLPDASY